MPLRVAVPLRVVVNVGVSDWDGVPLELSVPDMLADADCD